MDRNQSIAAAVVVGAIGVGAVLSKKMSSASSSAAIPATMRAVRVNRYPKDYASPLGDAITVEQVPTPVAKPGEVLVRIERSPINPSDLMNVRGLYAVPPPLPAPAGFEAAGTVVANGGGLMGWRLLGKRVAFATQTGAWQEYTTVPAMMCIPLPDDVSSEQGCSAIVNPFTVVCMIDEVKAQNVKAIVHTAAASSLGKMLVRYASKNGVEVINVVRRQEQADELKSLGARHILLSTDADFDKKFAKLTRELSATICFEAVAGELTGRICNAMPSNSTIYVYGALSEQALSGIAPGSLIFQGKAIKGFWLSSLLGTKSMWSMMRLASTVPSLLRGELSTKIRATYGLDDIETALRTYSSNMTAGKVLINPQLLKSEAVPQQSSL